MRQRGLWATVGFALGVLVTLGAVALREADGLVAHAGRTLLSPPWTIARVLMALMVLILLVAFLLALVDARAERRYTKAVADARADRPDAVAVDWRAPDGRTGVLIDGDDGQTVVLRSRYGWGAPTVTTRPEDTVKLRDAVGPETERPEEHHA